MVGRHAGQPDVTRYGLSIGDWLRRAGMALGLAALFWLVILLLGFAWLLHAGGRRF